ncbi:SDR family oxidoreductase [Aspergillus undulatus]|uniref:SDR family oxidoreductase n=1 Tax=Aspergillus undulatus TaxID=1810928 RepID=UPI003CCD1F22
MSVSYTVKSHGPFHGLPTYPQTPELSNLTAVVTGANGLSGYHMVRVLAAAPERWSKIYCLSRREPPSNFFSDLGEGAARVEHISVDFTSETGDIALRLKERVSKVDYVFFFSYMQPQQEGNVLGMWSDAEALTKINSTLLINFLGALNHASLHPKRFLLQTGAKHYGFHIGPATNPSFETDPRVTIESNFYYAQEDALASYCAATGGKVSWNVIRPSYIIGAVRDGALNHMVGLAIYAAVQAHLNQPLYFPGDYVSWDREFCQSTALLNAYFEEWTVLTARADNQAFNVQDGLPFTWSRFWPCLADWYGTTWCPPLEEGEREERASEYRVATSRHAQTPRGYGPPGITRSTFSLQEWSGLESVQNAWVELREKHDLVIDPFTVHNRAQIFGMTDSAVIGGWALSLSMRKARKLGFFGTVDSYESARIAIRDLARLRVVPPMTLEGGV